MAQQTPTYSPNDAISLVQSFGHGIPLTLSKAMLCDTVNSYMWTWYPWGWSLNSITAINLVDGTQDYTPTETNILRPVRMRLVRTDVTPNEYRGLDLLDNLEPELTRKLGLDGLRAVGWLYNLNKFRLDCAASVSSGQTLQLQGEYQKLPTKITDSNLASVFAFPDHFFNTYVEGLKWKVYQLSDDPRAGNISRDARGTVQYSGQLGIFMDSLNNMARTEDMSNGDEFMFPASSMGAGKVVGPGLFGL